MRSRDTDIIVVPGLGGSGSDHWQARWQAKLPNAHRVEQADWDHPRLDEWVEALARTVQRCERPVVLIAHSLGATTVAHAADRGLIEVAGAFLVAPPGDSTLAELPAIDPAFRPTPLRRLPFPSVVVGSRDDPHVGFDAATALAAAWGSTFIDAGNAGHINVESGHGPWPEGLMSFAAFLSKL